MPAYNLKETMNQYTVFDLDRLFEQAFFSNLDYYFAKSMAKAFAEKESIVHASCAMVSKLLSKGHICLDIKEMSRTVSMVSENTKTYVKFPDFDTWTSALHNSPMVSNTIKTPLVLDSDNKLYIAKYYDFQIRLAKNIAKRVKKKESIIDDALVEKLLEKYFVKNNKHVNNQKWAVQNALCNHLTIISGGPGTGKTYVTSIIKKMFFLLSPEGTLPKIICAAPTGKAASKMDRGSTIHSILKPLKNTPGFYYNKNNPLQADVVIIDEASMIDIVLLTRLLEAIPMTAKVIILGDQHQLSSIQAGSVFSDICNVKGLSSNIFFLEYNFRSKGKTGIENISKAINNNDDKLLEDILISGHYPDVVYEDVTDKNVLHDIITKYTLDGYAPVFNADSVEQTLEKLDNFKILCAHNSGEDGTLQINHICEKILRSADNFDIQDKIFKRIIMVNTNDYQKELFNGDTGIIFEGTKIGKIGKPVQPVQINKTDITGEGIKAFFKDQNNNIKQYRAADLPGHDSAFAITIHKSQGSEFNTVLLMIPDKLSPVITRQLLYTGVTRAKEKVIIAGNINIIKKAISLIVKRNSGLSSCLEKEI
jgi:exodeoxyribonuclease V alpha subunit